MSGPPKGYVSPPVTWVDRVFDVLGACWRAVPGVLFGIGFLLFSVLFVAAAWAANPLLGLCVSGVFLMAAAGILATVMDT